VVRVAGSLPVFGCFGAFFVCSSGAEKLSDLQNFFSNHLVHP
jgi:hypothetical protein